MEWLIDFVKAYFLNELRTREKLEKKKEKKRKESEKKWNNLYVWKD